MAIFVIKLVSKENNSINYYRKMVQKAKMVDGIKMWYWDFELTDDINKAEKFGDQEFAEQHIYANIAENQPAWANRFIIGVDRLPTRREMISLDLQPLNKMLGLVRGYNSASLKGKALIRKKLFNDELVGACSESIRQINLLK